MTTLITGGTGKVGGRLAKLLHSDNHPVLIATRTGKASEPFQAVSFDFTDPTTHRNPFEVDPNIDRIFLIIPDIFDTMPFYKPFINLAISKGVKRFVLVTSTQAKPGDPSQGVIHQYLLDTGVDFTVLRPTWFIQNFGVDFRESIREQDEIVSATGDGRIPFISSEDISQAAFDALTAEKSSNTDYYLVGPELHSFDEVAKLLSTITGREISHKRNSLEQQEEIYRQFLSPEYAHYLSSMEGLAARGKEESFFYEPPERKYVGKHTLSQYLKDNHDLFIR